MSDFQQKRTGSLSSSVAESQPLFIQGLFAMSNFEDLIKIVVSGISGAAIALIAAVINHRLGTSREREHLLYGKLVDKFIELEELTGFITERLVSFKGFGDYKEEVLNTMRTVDAKTGLFLRYKDVNQAIRDFMNSAGWMVSKGGQFATREERDQIVQELLTHHGNLLKACDKELGRKR
ncbi:MAG: hypothetical protein ACKVP0_23300 [Pirellulaceae bacterium]